jgi:hypothetical protein
MIEIGVSVVVLTVFFGFVGKCLYPSIKLANELKAEYRKGRGDWPGDFWE